MQKPIFRQTALERLSSPEQLDQLMPVTSLRGWLALLAVLGLVAALAIWSIFDRVSVQVSGRGILMRGGQTMQISAPATGQIEGLFISAEDEILAGQIIASLRPLSAATPALEVRSLVAGRVVEVAVAPGSTVMTGNRLATLEDTSQPLEAVIYVPAAVGQNLRAGMLVEVAPDHLSREAYGFMRGVVRSVAAFPASPQAMQMMLANEQLVEEFTAAGPPLEVRVTLTTWSAASAPSQPLQSGMLCTALFTIAERRPIELLLPSR